jgi:hypothetical protein
VRKRKLEVRVGEFQVNTLSIYYYSKITLKNKENIQGSGECRLWLNVKINMKHTTIVNVCHMIQGDMNPHTMGRATSWIPCLQLTV